MTNKCHGIKEQFLMKSNRAVFGSIKKFGLKNADLANEAQCEQSETSLN